jgi:hypothetical protein
VEPCASRSVPDGRTCVRRGARRKPCWVRWLLVVALHSAVSTGCSLVFTKGPQPEVQPPPPCTTDNGLPIADTVIAVASVAAVVAGAVVYANGTTRHNCGGWFCGFDEEVGGAGAMLIGGIGTVIFTPSAIVGYMRTADCRAWLQANPHYAPQPTPSTSSSLLVPARRCPSQGDAPLRCSSPASWQSSALVLDAPSGGEP